MAKMRMIALENDCDFHLPEDTKCKGSAAPCEVIGWVEEVKTEGENGETSVEYLPYRAEACTAIKALAYTKVLEMAVQLKEAVQIGKPEDNNWMSGKRPVVPPKKSGASSERQEWDKEARVKLKEAGHDVNEKGIFPQKLIPIAENLMKSKRPAK